LTSSFLHRCCLYPPTVHIGNAFMHSGIKRLQALVAGGFQRAAIRLRCPKKSSGLRYSSIFSTAAHTAPSLLPPLAAGRLVSFGRLWGSGSHTKGPRKNGSLVLSRRRESTSPPIDPPAESSLPGVIHDLCCWMLQQIFLDLVISIEIVDL